MKSEKPLLSSIMEEIYQKYGNVELYFSAFIKGQVYLDGHDESENTISLSFTGDLRYMMDLNLEMGVKTTINELIDPYKYRITSFYVWSDTNELITEYQF